MRHLDTCPNDAYIASVALENSLHGIAHLNPRDYNKIAKYYPVDAYAPAELAQY
jgi:predicted nucleic acid-binding protein